MMVSWATTQSWFLLTASGLSDCVTDPPAVPGVLLAGADFRGIQAKTSQECMYQSAGPPTTIKTMKMQRHADTNRKSLKFVAGLKMISGHLAVRSLTAPPRSSATAV